MAKTFCSAYTTGDSKDYWYYLSNSKEIIVHYKFDLGWLDPTVEGLKEQYPWRVIKFDEIEKVVQLPKREPTKAHENFAIKISDSSTNYKGTIHYITCTDTKFENALLDKMLFG